MATKTESFDTEELLHLAIHATQNNETEKAIDYLKRSVDIEAENAKVLFMLGSLHAEIGMYERAIKEMQQAVELEPDLYIAHFQLGLLQLAPGNTDDAKTSWMALDNLDEQHYLRLFRDGLLFLIQDKFDEATQFIQRGISVNQENLPLNNNMLNFIIEIEKAKAKAQTDSLQPQDIKHDENEGQRILSAYQSDL